MEPIPGEVVAAARFTPFEPEDVLYAFDGPRVFTVRDSDGDLHLACWSDEDGTATRYVVVPTTARTVEALRQGQLSVRDALRQPRCWLCEVAHDGQLAACRRVAFESLPPDALPAPGTGILPAHRPRPVPAVEQGPPVVPEDHPDGIPKR